MEYKITYASGKVIVEHFTTLKAAKVNAAKLRPFDHVIKVEPIKEVKQ